MRRKSTFIIANWDQADVGLRDLGLAQIALESIEGRLNTKIAALKEEAAESAAPALERIAELTDALEAFWLAHRGEVTGKSQTLIFGTLGQRASRAVRFLRGWTATKSLGALLCDRSLADFIRTAHTLDKDAVLKAGAAQIGRLRECGVGIQDREKFYAEPARVAIEGKEVA